MSDMVSKRWRAGMCKDSSLQIQKAHMLCSLHTHLSCSAVSHWMRFPCGLVPNAYLDTTFQICSQNRAHLCVQSGAECDSTAFHGLRHFCICRPAPAPAQARQTRYNLRLGYPELSQNKGYPGISWVMLVYPDLVFVP